MRLFDWPAWSRWLATALFFLVVNWLMLAPASTFVEVQEFLPHQDKIFHGFLFLALAGSVHWSLAAGEGRDWRRYGVLAALALYAAAIEALQPVLGGAGRQFDWLDLASNLAGVCAGWQLFGLTLRPA